MNVYMKHKLLYGGTVWKKMCILWKLQLTILNTLGVESRLFIKKKTLPKQAESVTSKQRKAREKTEERKNVEWDSRR